MSIARHGGRRRAAFASVISFPMLMALNTGLIAVFLMFAGWMFDGFRVARVAQVAADAAVLEPDAGAAAGQIQAAARQAAAVQNVNVSSVTPQISEWAPGSTYTVTVTASHSIAMPWARGVIGPAVQITQTAVGAVGFINLG